MVETGCVRELGNWAGDGNSSVLFNAYAAATGASFYSIDLNEEHCRIARSACPESKVLCGDSVATLLSLSQELPAIDFLYLDSFDIDWERPQPSAMHHLKELCAATPLLHSGSIVFVDDQRGEIGKGMYVRECLLQAGATQVHEGYQIGFVLKRLDRGGIRRG